MAKQYQISYFVKAFDQATATLDKIEKRLDRLDKAFEKSHNSENKRAKQKSLTIDQIRKKEIEYSDFWKKELDRRDKQTKQAIPKIEKVKAVSLDNTRKKEIEYSDFWKKELDRRDKVSEIAANRAIKQEEKKAAIAQRLIKQEEIARNKADRARDRVVRDQRRQQLQRYTDLSHAQESARSTMLYMATPATANALFALRNTMNMEQLGIRMRTQFGKEEGNKTMSEMVKYATESAFSVKETAGLITEMKKGERNLGIKSNEELISKTKNVGDVILAFASSPEGRAEIAYQLGQVASKGSADPRQDIKVMSNYGLTMDKILFKTTGKTIEQLKDLFGSEIPAKIIFDALEAYRNDPLVRQGLLERKSSLTQAWDTTKETGILASSAYGQVLSEQFGIKGRLDSISVAFQNIYDKLSGAKKESLTLEERMVAFGTAAAIAVPSLLLLNITMQKLWGASVATAGSTAALQSTLMKTSGAFAAIYALTIDWDRVMSDVKDDKFGGIAKHIDEITIGLLGVYGVLLNIQKLPILAGFLAIPAAIKYGPYLGDKMSDIADRMSPLSKKGPFQFQTGVSYSDIRNQIEERNRQSMLSKAPPPLVVQNTINIDKHGNTETKTRVRRDPNENPITVQQWNSK